MFCLHKGYIWKDKEYLWSLQNQDILWSSSSLWSYLSWTKLLIEEDMTKTALMEQRHSVSLPVKMEEHWKALVYRDTMKNLLNSGNFMRRPSIKMNAIRWRKKWFIQFHHMNIDIGLMVPKLCHWIIWII